MYPNLQYKRTNHFGHFLLTVLTGGLWLVIWVMFYMLNQNHNSRVDASMAQLVGQRNQQPQTIIIEHRNN